MYKEIVGKTATVVRKTKPLPRPSVVRKTKALSLFLRQSQQQVETEVALILMQLSKSLLEESNHVFAKLSIII